MGSPWPHTVNTDFYNQPITAPKTWWEDLQVKKTVIVAGGDEVFIDDIQLFESIFRGNGKRNVVSVICEGEFHDQPNVDLQLGFKESQQGEMAKVVKQWVNSIL